MKKNNKGFMLVEVIVTSTVVVTAMIALYASFSRLYNNYRVKTSYYHLDSVYATKGMIESMLENNDSNNINTFISKTFHNQDYEYLIKKNNCNPSISSVCPSIQELYKVENMIFIEYDENILKNFKDQKDAEGKYLINETLRDYIDYLITYYNIKKANEDYNYIVITEIKDENNYYYANLRMR